MNKFFAEFSSYLNIDTAVFYSYSSIALKIVFIILLSRLIIGLLNRVVSNLFKLYPRFKKDDKKSGTLAGILKSVIKYAVYIIMGISILDTLKIPTQPILATAGLGGIAIGFGAQSLIRDVFTGFFILFEDQYAVGDYVTINGITGSVEDMSLRTTRVRSSNGELHIIPNGEIKIVTNASRGNSLAIIDVSVAYESDQQRALKVLERVSADYYEQNKDKALDKPNVLGIIKLNEADVSIRTIIKTQPLMHWQVERELRMLILDAFKKEGIEIPYTKRISVKSN